jgi:signal transduction histidine kinase
VLDDIGLVAAIETYIREYRKRYDVAVDFSHHGVDTRLPVEYEAAAYRIVQETLTNVARHAQATSCRVALERDDQTVVLTIADDGVGFTPEADRRGGQSSPGLGLLSIRERVTRLHGSCRVESAPGRGTHIVAAIPLLPSVNTQPDAPEFTALAGRLADA